MFDGINTEESDAAEVFDGINPDENDAAEVFAKPWSS